MLLQKIPMLSTLSAKVAFSIYITLVGSIASAQVLYATEEQETDAFFNETADNISVGVSANDPHYIYLSLLRKLEDAPDKEKTLVKLKALADNNIADAKYSLYLIRQQIDSKSVSREDALNYLIASANDNYVPAQKTLATLYLSGKGVEKNAEKYYYWKEKAAQQGDGDAMIDVARCYFAGKGIMRDDTKGFQWVIKALNTQTSRFNDWNMLAQLYEQGRGTPVDLVKAYMCYDLEGTAGIDEKARIAPRMTEAERAEGLRLSREWQEQNHSYTFPALGLEHQPDGSYRHR
ncbi:tetratricopeptide repeat protein [Zymobacter sp. IVIA_12111.31 C1]|uniref:tetratricopeptide repeat protein n=1 Tax=Zymobacter sp. IVIA_12111.31 C1 TaxID=3394854 RepID=UPI0039C0DD3C